MDEIVAKYRVDVNEAVKNLNSLALAAQRASDALISSSKEQKKVVDGLGNSAVNTAQKVQQIDKIGRPAIEKTTVAAEKAEKKIDDIGKTGKRSFENTEKAAEKATKSIDNVKESSSNLSNVVNKLGKFLLAAFAVDRIIAFGKEAVQLAAKAEGVERAFERIGSPQILQGLRDATRGTVSDLVLMQNSVKASNFKIPLENLASLFKFAQARARETGESVDYLVDSIILGIGRKSPLILDNLGISAVELRTRLKGVGVEAANVGDIAKIIGDIATEELAKMGDQADTTADKIAQFTTKLENLKVVLGKIIAEDSAGVLTFFGNLAQAISDDISELDRFKQSLSGQSGLKLLNILTEERAKLADMETKATEKAGRVRDAEFAKIQRAVEFQREVVASINAELASRIDNNEEIEITTDLIEREIQKYKDRQVQADITVRSISLLNEQLKDLKTQFENAEIGGADWNRLIIESAEKTNELAEALTKAEARLVMFQQAKRGFDPFAEVAGEDTPFIDFSDSSLLVDYPEAVKETTDLADEMWQAHFAELMRLQDEAWDNDKKNNEEALQNFVAYASAIQDITNGITNAIITAHDNELSSLESQLELGQISREEYDKKRRQLERKKAIDQKNAAIFDAVIATALAVANALSVAPPLGYILAGISAALGAVQIGVITSQPLPSFKDGGMVKEHGLLKGKSHAQGGIAVEAEGNEYFMPTKQTAKNFGLLEAIRKGVEEQYIMKHVVPRMIDESLFKGMNDIGRSAELNGLTASLKDHNIIAGLDRLRQSQTYGFKYLAKELKSGRNQKRGGYNA